MRKLMWFSIGFAACCAAAAYLLMEQWLWIAGIVAAVIGICLCFLKPVRINIIGAILLGFSFAALWSWGYDTLFLRTVRAYDEKQLIATVELADYSWQSDYGTAANGKIELEGKRYRVRIYMDATEELSPGDRVRGIVELHTTIRGESLENRYNQAEGIFLVAYADEWTVVKSDKSSIRYFPKVLRKEILDSVDAVFPPDVVGFARALLLGDSTQLSYEEDTAFKVSGIRHVIAVSGLHVSILMSLLYVFSGRKPVLTAILGFPVLFLFAAVAGFTPSIMRAAIMQGFIILSMVLDEEYDAPTALGFSVFALLLWNPLMCQSVSLQLSAGCMAGILLFSEKIKAYLFRILKCGKGRSRKARLKRSIATSVAVSLSSMSLVTGLCAVYFDMVSIAGVITNLLTLWVITFSFCGIMVASVLGMIWVPLGAVAAWVVAWPIRYVLITAKCIAQIPVAAVYTCSIYIVIWLIFSYIVIAALLFSKYKRPALATGAIVASLALCIAASWIEPRISRVRATVINVGQGQSILLQNEGKYYLVDCGSNEPEVAADLVAAQLLSQGVFHLDGMILTHYDGDHGGGVPYLLKRIPADTLYLPTVDDETELKGYLTEQYAWDITWVRETFTVTDGASTVTMIPSENPQTQNESSLCILYQTEKCDILITGDRNEAGEKALMARYELPQVDLLVAGHHGAADATSVALLNQIRPKAVAISVSENNRYGHPDDAVLRRLEQTGCLVLRTDQLGTIQFRE